MMKTRLQRILALLATLVLLSLLQVSGVLAAQSSGGDYSDAPGDGANPPGLAGSITLSLTPDKAEAAPGDEVTVTLSISDTWGLDLAGYQYQVLISDPDALTYVSHQLNPNFIAQTGFISQRFNNVNLRSTAYASSPTVYNGPGLDLQKITFKVSEDFQGPLTVSVITDPKNDQELVFSGPAGAYVIPSNVVPAKIFVQAPPTEPQYADLKVLPGTIVAGHLSYIHITYQADLQAADPEFALLDQQGQIIGQTTVRGTDNKAILTLTAPDASGVYTIAALLNGQVVSQGPIEVLPYDESIWTTYTSVNAEGNAVIHFNEQISTKDGKYTQIISVDGRVVSGQLGADQRSLIMNARYEDLPDGAVITIKGIIFPRLYPSYSFTFTTSLAK